MQVGETKVSSKDVQLLLWAVGEARAGAGRRKPRRSGPRNAAAAATAVAGPEFFTEWQPSSR